ncbi:dihydroxyacetone kinase subunit DhaK [[Acholeplasma] multilocale]|uniref:dihydroxyacetone kinase subunit DhaK n=1 Tax=[Acholeplasma] multilocale TaxID=264638 RepID=UPI00042A4A1D|nr:dihydroxyacetone kinase subunit DhaK [[Acholeplasma] multilocale]
MKKFTNNIDQIVEEMIQGMVMANPETLSRVPEFQVITRKNLNKDKVAIISGGGSGHEPAHAGFVGTGMLDAAVLGPVFTSPAADQVLAAIKAVDSSKGVLLVIKNYTGDVLNFEMAKEFAAAENIEVETVIVNDDIALEDSLYTTGKRGIAGTILVHKIAGAAAELGKDLKEVKCLAQKAIDNLGSYGIGLDACIVPANGVKGFEIPENEMEVGLGIHGEPGVNREPIKSADEVIEMLYKEIEKHLNLSQGDEVAIMINGLGATPLMELNILARKALMIMDEKQITVNKTFVGNYMTAIDMPGFSLSILKLDDELKTLLNEPVITNGMVVI